MKKSMLLSAALIAATCVLSQQAQGFESVNLLKNGDFTEQYEGGLPADWTGFSHPSYLQRIQSTVTVVPDQHFLRITRKETQAGEYGHQTIALPSSVESVYVSLRARGRELASGDDWWQWPGLTYSWVLANGEETPIGPGRWLLLQSDSESWVTLETVLEKPQNATGIRVAFQGIGWTGEADFDQVTVEPLE